MPSAKNPTLSRQTIIHITFTRGRLPATALQCCIIYATSTSLCGVLPNGVHSSQGCSKFDILRTRHVYYD